MYPESFSLNFPYLKTIKVIYYCNFNQFEMLYFELQKHIIHNEDKIVRINFNS